MATTYSMTTEVELTDNPLTWQVKDLEALLLEKGRESLRTLFSQILRDYEKAFLKAQSSWNRKERWTKKVATLFGDIKLERYRVWDLQEKRSRYPLDEVLGIGKWQKETPSYQKALVEQTVQRSFRQSQREVERQTGSARSFQSAWRLTQKVAQNKKQEDKEPLAWKKLLLPDPPRPGEVDPCPALGIDLDDTYCRSWKTKRWTKDLGVRVAVIYRHKVRVGKRWLLKDKQVVASGPNEPVSRFLDRVTEKAITHYGLHQRTQVVVHGDGDPMIRRYALEYLPNALYRLDPWHVKKKIREATGLKACPESWEAQIYGSPEALIASLSEFQRQIASDDPSYERLTDLRGYLRNNREGLLPSGVSWEEKVRSPRLYLRGSGPIERNVDWTVNARCKLPRMSWSEQGLDNLLYLRESYLNQNRQPIYPPRPGSKLELLGFH
jgi:hypothetical protein